MCFSNLPVEFDDEGDPYLADEAEEVSQPGVCDHDHAGSVPGDCGCGAADDVTLDEAPDEAFEEILESVTDATRSHLADGVDVDGADASRSRDSAEGD